MPESALTQLALLLEALAAEPDPPTTIREPAAAVDRHVADSLSALEIEPLRAARRIADIGSGAGFPGLPLAIALSPTPVDLIEASGRKTATTARLARAARIENARAVAVRAEEWAAAPPALGGGREAYEAVTARALAPLVVLAEYASPLLRRNGVLIAWKGTRDEDEEAAARAAAPKLAMEIEQIEHVTPFEGAAHRHLHVLRKAGPTPDGLPRRPGMARKRPFGG